MLGILEKAEARICGDAPAPPGASPIGTIGPEAKAAVPEQAARPRILVADDNADMRGYVRRLLADRFEVSEAADGPAAWAAALASLPDLILSDVMMPGMDGFELLRRLRADARTREVPVILLSARAGEESRVE